LFLALALLWGATAQGETDLSRAKRERELTAAGTPAEPLPEVHVAPETLTVLLFPADIQENTLTVNKSRIRVVAIDVRSIIVRAAEDYRADEREELAVFFADGAAPARAAFALVMDPADVDIRIDVKRPELPAACPAGVSRADPLPEDFVLMGYVSRFGVQTAEFRGVADSGQGLSTEPGVSYRGNGWVLFDIDIKNLLGHPPFSPRGVTLTDKGGVTLRARLVTAGGDTIPPGKSARVLVVADSLPPTAGVDFALEVVGDTDRRLVLPRVTAPLGVTEGKR
jgi:uncharacterized protein (TIGR02268 family)